MGLAATATGIILVSISAAEENRPSNGGSSDSGLATFITAISTFPIGGALLAAGIPLWAVGVHKDRKTPIARLPQAPRMQAELLMSPRSIGYRLRF
jgi:hypothetical protein